MKTATGKKMPTGNKKPTDKKKPTRNTESTVKKKLIGEKKPTGNSRGKRFVAGSTFLKTHVLYISNAGMSIISLFSLPLTHSFSLSIVQVLLY